MEDQRLQNKAKPSASAKSFLIISGMARTEVLPKPELGKTAGSLMLETWGRCAAASDSGPGGIIDTIQHFISRV